MNDFTQHPFRQIFKGAHGDVLWVLARSRISRHAADIARISGRSKSQVKLVLERMHELRIVDRTFIDGWSWNCLNDAHPYAAMVRSMARTDFDLSEVDVPKAARAPDFWVGD